ncbi:hypothetical protein E2C01_025065 [Portunus trituberculatus]|uniref:Uncharacterized protein n=1 Tax=Portunus trituberculatus TaxID=210409 RepID=A0A5B7EC24_PORTR|nr:hypothetical protein [Portunus trituberculatus]
MILECPLVRLSPSSISDSLVYLSFPSLLHLLFPVYPSKLVVLFPSVFLHRKDPLFLGPSL